MSRVGGWLRRGAVQVAVVAVGLSLGVGGTALYRARTSGHGYALTPSAKKFSFATSAASPVPGAPADAIGGPVVEPADAGAAVTAFLQAEVDGRPEVAWTLLDARGHQRWPTAPAWLAAQPDLAAPTSFHVTEPTVTPAAGAHSGDVDLHVDVNRRPSLDPFRGLVAAHSAELWRARDENGRWRVAAAPVESHPDLPADGTASDAVKAWVGRLSACDQAGAATLQLEASLLGPADVAAMPCRLKTDWTVGAPVGIDRGGDVQPLLAAYGQGAGSWARLVPVTGAGRNFWAEVAPLGDAWMVVGVAAGG
jgi:hypothetical protein